MTDFGPIRYSLIEEDIINYQLYFSSKNPTHIRRRWILRIVFFLTYFVLGLLLILNNGFSIFGIICMLIAFIVLFFYPKYSKWNYKRHFKNNVKKFLSSKVNTEIKFEIKDGFVETSDQNSSYKVKTSELDALIELEHHLFLKMKNEECFIFPKMVLEDEVKLKAHFQKYDIPLIQDLNWKWK